MLNVKKIYRKITFIFLSFFILFSGCAVQHYAGKELPKEQLATITIQRGPLIVETIDGEKPDRPNPTKSFLIGGGYVGLTKALATTKAQILPGPHTLNIIYKKCVSGGGGSVSFEAKAGHSYRIACAMGESLGNYKNTSYAGKQEIITTFTDVVEYKFNIFVEDVTEEKAPIVVGKFESRLAIQH